MILLKICYLFNYILQRCKDGTKGRFIGGDAMPAYYPPMISTKMNPRFKQMEPNRFIRIELA